MSGIDIRICYAMSGIDMRTCYAMSGIDLRTCYAMSGTDTQRTGPVSPLLKSPDLAASPPKMGQISYQPTPALCNLCYQPTPVLRNAQYQPTLVLCNVQYQRTPVLCKARGLTPLSQYRTSRRQMPAIRYVSTGHCVARAYADSRQRPARCDARLRTRYAMPGTGLAHSAITLLCQC
eukprot:749597-Rhodomonas_salina.4